MFNKTSTPVIEPAPVVVAPAELVPLSHLELDLAAPEVGGWGVYLTGRGIEVLTDDLGRLAISRDNARQLLSEQREHESRVRELAAERERQAIELDRQRRASLPAGIPAGLIPEGMTGASAMMMAEYESRPPSVREQLLEQELSRSDEMVYQPFPSEPDESS